MVSEDVSIDDVARIGRVRRMPLRRSEGHGEPTEPLLSTTEGIEPTTLRKVM
jgi:hypothetical protein